MDKPSATLAQQLQEACPNCRSTTPPVVTEQSTPSLLTAAYRCVMCRTDFTSIWQQGYVRQSQPTLPGLDNLAQPITQDVLTTPGVHNPDYSQPLATTTPHPNPRSAPDGVCQSCLAQPGTPHALACPYA